MISDVPEGFIWAGKISSLYCSEGHDDNIYGYISTGKICLYNLVEATVMIGRCEVLTAVTMKSNTV